LAKDFRQSSQDAAQVAARLAAAFESRVTVFHVVERFPTWPMTPQEHHDRFIQELKEQNVDVTDVVIGVGPPADTIVRKAQELDVDLILMGAGERDPRQRFALGPVAQAVVELASQPVLIVKPGEPQAAFRRILCPVDQSPMSGRGLRNAIRLARACGGEVVVVTVVPEVTWLSAAVETGELRDAKAEYDKKWRQEFERFLAGIPTHDVKATPEVRHGAAHEQIVAAAREHGADVIVMGATGRTGLVRMLLGSTTRRVLEQLPCSLLIVKDEDAVEELFDGEVRLIQSLMSEGRTLLGAGDAGGAVAKYRLVLTHDPFHVGAAEGLVEAYQKLGNQDLAHFYRRRVERLRAGA
jgi:nucleotide-binding universal stress UspA family protein